MEIRGKTALVTGAGRGLGRSIALALADAGANVVAHYHESEAGAAETAAKARLRGVRAAHIGGDLGNAEEACQFIRWAAQVLAPPEILINSAAVFEPGTLLNTTMESWDRHLAVNLRGPFFTMQSFAAFLEEREGKVVNVSDWRGACPGRAYFAYAISKSALHTMTEMGARELAPRVQVNAVALGPVESGPESVVAAIPAKRSATVGEIVDSVLFLLRNDYVTGETLFVDGGAHTVHA